MIFRDNSLSQKHWEERREKWEKRKTQRPEIPFHHLVEEAIKDRIYDVEGLLRCSLEEATSIVMGRLESGADRITIYRDCFDIESAERIQPVPGYFGILASYSLEEVMRPRTIEEGP